MHWPGIIHIMNLPPPLHILAHPTPADGNTTGIRLAPCCSFFLFLPFLSRESMGWADGWMGEEMSECPNRSLSDTSLSRFQFVPSLYCYTDGCS